MRYVPMAGLQFAAFTDAGRVQLSQRPWTDERNQRRLSAAGLSITQAGPSHQVMAAMAWPIQRETDRTAPSRNRASGYAPRATSDRPPPSAAAPCHAESGTSSNPRRNPMNKTHTVIWNASKACWTVASECARRRGKSGVSGARAVLAAVAAAGLSALAPQSWPRPPAARSRTAAPSSGRTIRQRRRPAHEHRHQPDHVQGRHQLEHLRRGRQ